MPPFPGMPYGAAPAWTFPLFEISLFVLFFICLVYAVKKGADHVSYLFGGLAFGLVLEYIEVITGSYTYGHFFVMLGKTPLDIPVCIGVGWGIIMYTARLFTDRLGFPLLAAAALDTLLALNIDLSMDTVAYRLHMWNWNWSGTGLSPLTGQWFGIPYGNFVGWQTVVFCYSLFSRLFQQRLLRTTLNSILRSIIVAIAALVCSQVVLFTTENYLYPWLGDAFGMRSVHRLILFSVVFLILVVTARRRNDTPASRIPAIAWWVPGWFHVFFFGCLFLMGFYQENIWLTIVACINFAIGVVLHVFPVRFGRSATNEMQQA